MATDLVQLKALGADGPTITEGAWTYSASQLRTYHDCKRKWFFAKVLQYPEPAGPAAELGKSIHSEVEAYIKDGTEPAEDSLAWHLLQNLGSVDLTREDLTVEGRIRFLVYPGDMSGPWFLGFLDLTIPPLKDDERLVIWDHKSTSNLKWAKSEHELHHDIQMVSYAHWAFQRLDDLYEVEVVHSYVQTKGVPETRVVRAILTRAKVEARWAEHVKLIEDMERTRALGDVRKVAISQDACGKYGGCPHSGNCARAQFGQEIGMFNPPDAAEPGREETMQMNNALQERLAAIRAQVNGGDTPPATPPDKVEAKLKESVQAKVDAAVQNIGADGSDADAAQAMLEAKNLDTKIQALVEAKVMKLAPELEAHGFGARTKRALQELNVTTVAELLDLDANKAKTVQGCGDKVVGEIQAAQDDIRTDKKWAEINDTRTDVSEFQTGGVVDQPPGSSPIPDIAETMILSPSIEITDITVSMLKAVAEKQGVKITVEIGG